MPYDPERHHRRSIRASNYDYARNGAYFITICTAGREMLFGEVRDRAMIMNEFGWLVWEEWERSAEIRKEIQIDDFVVMPNHLHGLIMITPDNFVGAQGLRPEFNEDGDASRNQSARDAGANLDACHMPLRRKPRSVGSFVAGFKGATTRLINEMRGTEGALVWQRNYYERIVRNERMWDRIATYITYNPMQRSLDRENPDRTREDSFEQWLFAEPGTRGGRP